MHILITGATGLIGKKLTKKLLKEGYSVSILTRNKAHADDIFSHQVTSYQSLQDIDHQIRFHGIINLAGESIANKRWTTQQKQKLCLSRWTITEQLCQWIKLARQPPEVLISGSAIGYYGSQGSEVITEQTLPHPGFTHDLCVQWEQLAKQAESTQTRVCCIRTSIVLAGHGGVIAKLLPLFRCGLGGIIAGGQQYMAWIHLDDIVEAIYFLLTQPTLHGPFNLCAPHPVTNSEFSKTLADILHKPCVFPIPAWTLRLIMGESASLVTDSQRAIPANLQQANFSFSYPLIYQALQAICYN